MEGLELMSFQIISNVGNSKSLAMEAISEVREGNYELARKKLSECGSFMTEAHHVHMQLIQKEANGDKIDFSLILMHAEDQMMSAETIIALARELVEMYIELKK